MGVTLRLVMILLHLPTPGLLQSDHGRFWSFRDWRGMGERPCGGCRQEVQRDLPLESSGLKLCAKSNLIQLVSSHAALLKGSRFPALFRRGCNSAQHERVFHAELSSTPWNRTPRYSSIASHEGILIPSCQTQEEDRGATDQPPGKDGAAATLQ
jgi:hypothetical protein